MGGRRSSSWNPHDDDDGETVTTMIRWFGNGRELEENSTNDESHHMDTTEENFPFVVMR